MTASKQLDIGAIISEADLSAAPWPGSVPKGMVTKKDGVVGRGVVATINAGEPIFENRLAETGAGGGLAAIIPPGMRAVAVRVNDVVGVAGFVLPGMRVDVLISGIPPGAPGTGGPQVKTLLQNIQVLSAGQNYQKDNEGKAAVVGVVNLLVTPEQAEILSLASNETRIQLILRNPLDTQQTKTPGTAVANLYSGRGSAPVERPRQVAPPVRIQTVAQPARVVAPPPPPPFRVEILNGPQRTEVTFSRAPEVQKQ